MQEFDMINTINELLEKNFIDGDYLLKSVWLRRTDKVWLEQNQVKRGGNPNLF